MEAVKDFKDLLKDLQSHRDKNTYDIYVPSCQDSMGFKPITVTQQSDIISSLLVQERDSNAYSYSKIINDIIKSNSVNDTSEYRSFDRSAILIQMRINTIGDHITISDNVVDLTSLKDNYTLTPTELQLLTDIQTHSSQDITISYTTPSLQEESKIATAAEKKWKELEGEDIITELFVIEIVKYLQSVDFQDQQINFSELSFEQKIQVCNMLPMSHSRKVMEYVQETKEIEQRFFSVEIDGEQVQIPLNTALFSTGT